MDDLPPVERLLAGEHDQGGAGATHDHIFYGPPPSGGPVGSGDPGAFGIAPPDGYDEHTRYTGPRISVPNTPPPPPHRERKTRRVGGQIAAAVIAVVVVAGAAGVIGLVTSDGSPGGSAAQSSGTNPSTGSGNDGSNPAPGSSTSTNKPDVSAITAEVDPAVVDITSTLSDRQGEAAGTGMVVTPTGEVLTNNHVIDEAVSITAQIDGRGPSTKPRSSGRTRRRTWHSYSSRASRISRPCRSATPLLCRSVRRSWRSVTPSIFPGGQR